MVDKCAESFRKGLINEKAAVNTADQLTYAMSVLDNWTLATYIPVYPRLNALPVKDAIAFQASSSFKSIFEQNRQILSPIQDAYFGPSPTQETLFNLERSLANVRDSAAVDKTLLAAMRETSSRQLTCFCISLG